ncbi:NAD-dependent epimerase/dehydratase family protein [bacterium]|nr:NAD-dependent epimerase/dehydratase family protein [bacterium]
MKILILGGHGFIGCQVSNILVNQGHTVAVVDNNDNYNDIPKWEFKEILNQKIIQANTDLIFDTNINEQSNLDKIFYNFLPDVVIHLATYANAHFVKDNPVIATDNMITSTIKILDLCKQYNTKRFVFASSSMVYGNFTTAYEDQYCNPNTLYGSFKLQGEFITKNICSQHGIEWVVLRPSSVYGYPDFRLRVISKMVDKAISHKKIKVIGNESLDFTFVRDLANYFANAATNSRAANQVFNATRGRARKLLDVAEIIKQEIGGEIELTERDGLYPSRGTLNSDKIINTLQYNPQTDIEIGIKNYINWFQNQDYYKSN